MKIGNADAVIADIRDMEPGSKLMITRGQIERNVPLNARAGWLRDSENIRAHLAEELGQEFEIRWLRRFGCYEVYRHVQSEPRMIVDMEIVGRLSSLPPGAPKGLVNAGWAELKWDDGATTYVDVGGDCYAKAMDALLNCRPIHQLGYAI